MSAQSKLEKITSARAEVFADSPARQRLVKLFDAGSFVELDGFVRAGEAPAGVVCGYGAVLGSPVYAFAQDSSQNGGAVGAAHAAKIKKVYDLALKTGAPVVGIYDSNGARVEEGAGALNAYGDILLSVNGLSGVVPQISLVLGTCAGTSAMLACSADFVIMSEQAEFFVANPAAQAGAEGAGSAQAAAKAGVAHIVQADDDACCQAARTLLARLPINNLASPPIADFTDPAGESALRAACEDMAGADAEAIVNAVVDAGSSLELLAGFGKKVYAGVATMGGFPVAVIATKGDKLCRNCCAKIAKVVSVFDSFQLPVLTFVNTSGMASDAASELCGSVRDMAKLAHVYAEATTAKLAVITGEAYGSAYVALASRGTGADYTVAWPSAAISALSPQTAVAFLYADRITKEKSREAVEAEYMENEASPVAAAQGGYIDDVIDPAVTRPALLSALDLLSAKRVQRNPKKHSNVPM